MNRNYLSESYGGSNTNPLKDKCFFCYTIYDIEFDKYYSGVKTRNTSSTHGLLETYFTSSTVVDFKYRLKSNPKAFLVRIEYFLNKTDAFAAEKVFHSAHKVGKNKAFYNACSAGGSHCGAGSVLCVQEDGTIYRVSVEEYGKGLNRSVSAGRMNVYVLPDMSTLKKIYVSEYDPTLHVKELTGTTTVLDTFDGKCKRISTDEYLQDKSRYCGVTKGFIYARKLGSSVISKISVEEYKVNSENYVVAQRGMISVIDRASGEYVYIPSEAYKYNKAIYLHPNCGMVSVFDTVTCSNVRIPKEEYYKDKLRYVNHARKNLQSYVEVETGKVVNISRQEFLSKPNRYAGHTKGTSSVINLINNSTIRVTSKEFKDLPTWVISANIKEIFHLHNLIFTNKSDLGYYIRKAFNKTIFEARVILKNITEFLLSNNGYTIYIGSNNDLNFREEDFYVKKD